MRDIRQARQRKFLLSLKAIARWEALRENFTWETGKIICNKKMKPVLTHGMRMENGQESGKIFRKGNQKSLKQLTGYRRSSQ